MLSYLPFGRTYSRCYFLTLDIILSSQPAQDTPSDVTRREGRNGLLLRAGNIPAVSVAYNLNILNCNRHTIEHNTLTVTVASACKICFALGLSESAAEHILGITAENGIHYRNPKELIYAFCLRKGLDYPEARRMIEEYWQNPFPDGRLEYQKQIRETSDSEQKSRKTIIVKNKFKNIRTQEELRQFIQENRENFGVHHNTAYRKFVKMLERLMYCESDGQVEVEEKEYGIERVVNEYLRMEVPYDKKSKGYTWLQKEIKRYWPTPKMIQDMYRRKEDVNRKTLILLYLATEGMGPDKEGDWKSQVKEHYRRINLMLSGCGMALLNLHSPFDYLVMQAIHKENEEEFMVTRMEGMLGRLFRKDRMAAYVGRREKKNTACKTESREK